MSRRYAAAPSYVQGRPWAAPSSAPPPPPRRQSPPPRHLAEDAAEAELAELRMLVVRLESELAVTRSERDAHRASLRAVSESLAQAMWATRTAMNCTETALDGVEGWS